MKLEKDIDLANLKALGQPILWLLALVLVYVLSVGPVIRYTETVSPTGRRTVPHWVNICYYPLLNSNANVMNNLLDRYIQFWTGEE